MTISYTLTIDQQNERSQGFFGSTTKKTRNFTSTLVLRNKFTCVQREVYMLVSYSLDKCPRVKNSACICVLSQHSNKSYATIFEVVIFTQLLVIKHLADVKPQNLFETFPPPAQTQATFLLQENGADTPSHVSVSLNFHQVDTEGAPVVLNVDSKRHVLIQVSTEGHTASSRRSQTD